jgi:hypothetical protein
MDFADLGGNTIEERPENPVKRAAWRAGTASDEKVASGELFNGRSYKRIEIEFDGTNLVRMEDRRRARDAAPELPEVR